MCRRWCRQYIEAYSKKLLAKSTPSELQKELDVSICRRRKKCTHVQYKHCTVRLGKMVVIMLALYCYINVHQFLEVKLDVFNLTVCRQLAENKVHMYTCIYVHVYT